MGSTQCSEVMLSLLRKRRSVPRVSPELPPRALVERVLECGTWAPNHHRTHPWRFIVVAGDAREALGRVMEQSLRRRLGNVSGEAAEAALAKEHAKPLRAPVIVVAATEPSTQPKVVEIEEIQAVAAAVENMLLAAEALGLGAMWRTGEAAYDPAIKQFLGLSDACHIVAFIYLGYPDTPERLSRHPEAIPPAKWLGWPE